MENILFLVDRNLQEYVMLWRDSKRWNNNLHCFWKSLSWHCLNITNNTLHTITIFKEMLHCNVFFAFQKRPPAFTFSISLFWGFDVHILSKIVYKEDLLWLENNGKREFILRDRLYMRTVTFLISHLNIVYVLWAIFSSVYFSKTTGNVYNDILQAHKLFH